MIYRLKKRLMSFLIAFLCGMTPLAVYAHTNYGETSGFLHGLQHPISGLDHILAMLAVGLWASQLGGLATWAVPLAFVGTMVLGGILGIIGVSVPFVEQGIIASDLILGGLILMVIRLPLSVSIIIVGLLAIFHGYAHGAEMPKAVSGLEYALGFAVATAGLHLLGMLTGVLAKKLLNERVIQFAGGGIVLGAIYLLFGALTAN